MLQKSSRCHPTRVLTRLFNCTKCKKGFTTAKAALKHEKDHHSEDGKPFKCKLCQVKFSHSWAVTNHLRKGRCKGSQTISWGMLNLCSANMLRSHLLPKNKLHDLHVTNERFLIETFLLLPQVIILSTYYCTWCFYTNFGPKRLLAYILTHVSTAFTSKAFRVPWFTKG